MTQKQRIPVRMLRTPVSLALAFTCAASGTYLLSRQVSAEASSAAAIGEAHPVFSHSLPKLDGTHLQVKVVEVSYGPGGPSPTHSHPCPVIAVVTEGAIRTQVKGEPEAIYKAGQGFYEAPNGVHLVSANADKTKPAKLLAYFICDHETPDTVAVPAGKAAADK